MTSHQNDWPWPGSFSKVWAQGLGTALHVGASLLCSHAWSLLLEGPWLLQIASLLVQNKMDFSMKNTYATKNIFVFVDLKMGWLAWHFTLLWLEEKKKFLLPSEIFMIWGGKRPKKHLLNVSGSETPVSSGKGSCSSKSRLHHTPKPPTCFSPALSTHSALAAYLLPKRSVCFGTCSPSCLKIALMLRFEWTILGC